MWETTAATLADLPADEVRLDTIKERVRERFVTFNSNSSTPAASGPVAHAATYPQVLGLSFLSNNSSTLYCIDATGRVFDYYFQAQSVLFTGPGTGSSGSSSPSGTVNQAGGPGGSPNSGGSGGGKQRKKKCCWCPNLTNHWTNDCKKDESERVPTCKRCLKEGHFSPACSAAEPRPSVVAAESNKGKGKCSKSATSQHNAMSARVQDNVSKSALPSTANTADAITMASPTGAYSAKSAQSSMANTGFFPTMFNTKDAFETLAPVDGAIETANVDSTITNIEKGIAVLKVLTKKNQIFSIKLEALYSAKL